MMPCSKRWRDYHPLPRTLQKNNIKEDTESHAKNISKTYLPVVERQINETVFPINFEELLVVIEENETTKVDEFIEHELRN